MPVRVLSMAVVRGPGGGIEKTMLRTPRHLEGSGFEELAVLLHPPGDKQFRVLEQRALHHGAELLGWSESLPVSALSLARLARICRERDVGIWHAHDYKSNLYGWILRPICKFALVSTVHGWVSHTRRARLHRALDHKTLRAYERVIAVSAALRDACRDAGVSAERLTLIENGVDTQEFRRKGTDRLSQGRFRIGAMGRLEPEKGFFDLIAAAERMLGEGCDVEVRIAGDGSQRESLMARIRESRWADRIELCGFQEDPRTFMDSLDVFCLSSLREGLPNVLLEAMSMELPIAATTAGGLGGMLREGEDALLCAPGSPRELARALLRLVQEPGLAQRLARNARRRVVEQYEFSARVRAVADVYRSLPIHTRSIT